MNNYNIGMAKDNLPVYKITIDPEYAENGEDLGIEQIAFTSTPAIKVMGMAFNSQVKPMVFKDAVKYRIVAPALIPMEIYRKDDEDGKEYYVKFSIEEIEKIHSKFMRDMSNKDLFNLEHDTTETVPAYVLEAWIVDNPLKDKAYSSFGIEVPTGTLMVTAQVTDVEYYNHLVDNDQVGFSIEGYLGMKLKEVTQLKTDINMNKLPDGEHTIDGKIYVVVDGEITEIRDAEVVEATLADTVVEEEEVVEEETMAVDPALDAEAILEIVRPFITEQVDALVAMIADLKNQFEESMLTETEEEVMEEVVALSAQQKLSMFNKFNNNK
jgi:Putative phage serine protease XkdF